MEKVNCDECNGYGYIRTTHLGYWSCQVCGGVGKTDWVSNIIRPKNFKQKHFQCRENAEVGIKNLSMKILMQENLQNLRIDVDES